MKDTIILFDTRYFVRLGVSSEERARPQNVFVDMQLFCDVSFGSKSDNINDTLNYSLVNKAVAALIEEKEYKLIERMAEEIAQLLLKKFSLEKVIIKVKKPNAQKNAAYCAVEIERRRSG